MRTATANRQILQALRSARCMARAIERNRSSGFSSDVIDRSGRVSEGSARR